MRGHVIACGFIIYNKDELCLEMEDTRSFLKFSAIMIVSALLLATVQQIALQIVFSLLMLYAFFKIICETAEWHAIEHKVIYLLENDCPSTLDSFKKISSKHNRCGFFNITLEPSTKKMNMALAATKIYLNKKNKKKSPSRI